MNDNFNDLNQEEIFEEKLEETHNKYLDRAYTKAMMEKTLGVDQDSTRDQQLRLESLKLALEICNEVGSFANVKNKSISKSLFLKELSQIYEVAENNFRYLKNGEMPNGLGD